MQEKNVESDMLEGRVGRIYMPKQAIDSVPQHKMKVSDRYEPPCTSELTLMWLELLPEM